ncbi:hypothetical protein [Actinacidiphila paucisporea]|uniref:Uncharacterized protein n=1 Tax=Actinacidiphila paucisporea TaxID=310782 RepID=A0A1M7QZJ3_9ACTN|nr:hypothetical protein [Actinacidiphila paucisporea]SHN37328.1 hypothetical protein SAMN05216499_1524 [Actinacidiphila paucisporea]
MSVLGWIAVPGGRIEVRPGAANVAVLRVLIVPRLQQQLASTAMEDWPAVLAQAAPVVEVQLGDAVLSPLTCRLRILADSTIWRGFFGHGITVNPWQPPEAPPKPAVNDTLQQADDITATYRAAGNSPADPGVAHGQLAAWHRTPAAAPPAPGAPAFAAVDFHRATSLLREHPHVLKALGLILELELIAADLPVSASEPHARVRVGWPQSPIPVESPWTAYQLDAERVHFLPAPAGDITAGQVALSDASKWRVVTVDVDGAVGKLTQAAHAVVDDPEAAPATVLPALRSAGLQLARVDRAGQLSDRSARGRANTAAGSLAEHVFTAEDLVLGYRLDVRPQKSNTWYSLHTRLARYQVDGMPIGSGQILEEGHLKPHAAVKDASGALRADEIVARWSGWSLAVPRPAFDGLPAVGEPTDAAGALIPYRFTMDFEVAPESLPELRFGTAYQLRMRVVDMAGGGLLVDDPDAAASPTAETSYTRYEPVPPPEVTLPDGLLVPDPDHPGQIHVDPHVLGPGGGLEQLVIRSSPGLDGFSTAEFADDPTYPANARRSLTPPATTFQLAEQHGVLSVDNETGWARATRAGGVDPASTLPDPMALGVAATLPPQPGGPAQAVTDARPWAGAWPDHEPKHLELVPGDNLRLSWLASGAAVSPADDAQSTTVRVSVPPGHRVVAEVSSTILRDHLDWFAIGALVSAGAAELAVVGRHPMVNPPRQIELVHAVRKPINAPSGSLTTSRTAGASYAVLHPHDTLLGLHTESTAQLNLMADWQEWDDTATSHDASVAVPAVPVAYGATALPEIRQEFGDTKHRMIRYTASAISRYRAYFTPADDSAFTVSTTLEPVSVKSSTRPAPPHVLATVPAFSWSDTSRPGGGLVRTRSGGRLRVELDHPWYITGEGECVAVLVWPGTEDTVPAEVRPLVSWLNRDPIHPTPSPQALATETMFGDALDSLDVVLVETGTTVRALPYPVFWHDGRWYADIGMPGAAQTSYAPFTHLALARFQRESLDGLNLSTVARSDIVPVLPDRTLEVHQDGDGLHVLLKGLSREGNKPNTVVAVLERCDTADDGTPVDLTALNTAAAPAFPAWVRVPGATAAGQTNQPLPPIPVPADGSRLRVVVREAEDLPSTAAGIIDAVHELTERTVYLDEVSLPVV